VATSYRPGAPKPGPTPHPGPRPTPHRSWPKTRQPSLRQLRPVPLCQPPQWQGRARPSPLRPKSKPRPPLFWPPLLWPRPSPTASRSSAGSQKSKMAKLRQHRLLRLPRQLLPCRLLANLQSRPTVLMSALRARPANPPNVGSQNEPKPEECQMTAAATRSAK
jgi:hypothetical protein